MHGWQSAHATISTGTDTELVAAPGAEKAIEIGAIVAAPTTPGTDGALLFEDGQGGTVLHAVAEANAAPLVLPLLLHEGLRCSENNALSVDSNTGTTGTWHVTVIYRIRHAA